MDKDVISVRTLFLSDLHLGFRYARPGALLSFLRRFRPEQIYLVGDVIDGWCFQRDWYWYPECTDLLDCLVDLSRSGTNIRIAIGNHDAFLRQPVFRALAGSLHRIELSREFDHLLPDGRRILVTHGDQFDPCEKFGRFTTWVLSCLYKMLLACDRSGGRQSQREGSRNETALAFLKRATGFLSNHAKKFQTTASRYARFRGFHGIVCGHLHRPDTVHSEGFSYINTGDWVENCSGLIEDLDGQLHLLKGEPTANSFRGEIPQTFAIPSLFVKG